MFNKKQKKPFVSLRFIVRIITASSLAQAIKAQNGAGLDFFCRDTGSIQGPSLLLLLLLLFFLFLFCFSSYFTNQNIYLKINLLSKLLKVIV